MEPSRSAKYCRLLPRGYWRYSQPPRIPDLRCARAQQDEILMSPITQVWQESFCVDGADQMWQPDQDGGLIHHSDTGSQYVSIGYTERLAVAGIAPSVGSKGDSYDNALAKTINGLYKAAVIHHRGPWKTRESVELATLEWVFWFNQQRLLEPIGDVPPAEYEAYY